MARTTHLVARFFGSLFAGRPRPGDVAWVAAHLTPAELRLWQRMGRIDQVESLRVAHRFVDALGTSESAGGGSVFVAAALLHDVGKRDCGLGTVRRALATVVGRTAGPETCRAWIETAGFMRKVGLYVHHAELGATAVRVAGGREPVARWVGAHHDPSRWPTDDIPAPVCRALALADGERLQ